MKRTAKGYVQGVCGSSFYIGLTNRIVWARPYGVTDAVPVTITYDDGQPRRRKVNSRAKRRGGVK